MLNSKSVSSGRFPYCPIAYDRNSNSYKAIRLRIPIATEIPIGVIISYQISTMVFEAISWQQLHPEAIVHYHL